jgi:hypothetical protein
MVEAIEALGYVSFNDPYGASTGVPEFLKSRVTASLWAKPMRVIAESRLIVGLK